MKRLLALMLLESLTACALFSKGEVTTRRYFSVETPSGALPANVGGSHAELRLGRVTSGASIAERMMFRESANEVGFYDDRIWTEKPEASLRRGLVQVLFEQQGLRSVMRGPGATLDVELVSFEEVLAPNHVGRVRVSFSLGDERTVSLQQTITVERPIAPATAGNDASAVALSMGDALREVIHELSNRVVAELAKSSAADGTRRTSVP